MKPGFGKGGAATMFEREDDTAQISFQWTIGDTRALEKNIVQLRGMGSEYVITVVSRLAAYGLTFVVANALLPGADFLVVLSIAFVGSLSIWASLGLELLAVRALERLRAEDPYKVGWNSIWFDRSGIVWRTEMSEEYLSWLGVFDVVEQDGSLWIKTGPANGFYIPPRVFATPQELSDCQDLVRSLREDPHPPAHMLGSGKDLVKH